MTWTRTVSAIVVVSASLSLPSERVLGQRVGDLARPSASESARNIANTIQAFAPKGPQGPFGLKFESAVADGNTVNINYSIVDAATLARIKADPEFKAGKVGYFCNESRLAPIRQGVVIHEVTATADGRDRIEIVVDRKVCDSLVKPALADSGTLSQLAQSIAKAENDAAQPGSDGPIRLEKAVSHDAVVERQVTVRDATASRANLTQIKGVISGYNCGKYREQILRGVVFRYTFVFDDGGPSDGLVIDRSKY